VIDNATLARLKNDETVQAIFEDDGRCVWARRLEELPPTSTAGVVHVVEARRQASPAIRDWSASIRKDARPRNLESFVAGIRGERPPADRDDVAAWVADIKNDSPQRWRELDLRDERRELRSRLAKYEAVEESRGAKWTTTEFIKFVKS
jgi:hypothetical protein